MYSESTSVQGSTHQLKAQTPKETASAAMQEPPERWQRTARQSTSHSPLLLQREGKEEPSYKTPKSHEGCQVSTSSSEADPQLL